MRSIREPEISPCVYLPLEADYQRMITLYARTPGSALAAAPAIRSVVQELDRNLPFEARTLETYLSTAISRERLAAAMLSGLGVFTTLLAAIGLYGLISVTISQRLREIGIRMALGARRELVVATVLKRFVYLLAIGSSIGLLASAALSRFVEPLVFGVKPLDPIALGTALLLLSGVAIAASALPALRAAFTSPMSVLRQD
jgi:ABC-type antimicrobial peptide transport system permease subunit